MKKALALVASMVPGMIATAPVWAEVYVIEDGAGDKPLVIEKDDPALADVPDINGLPNEGFSYATRYITAGTGLRVHHGRVEANGSIAVHEGANVYVLYVVNGSGRLFNTDPDGEVTSEVLYKANDIIVFREGTLHGWKNGEEQFDFIGFEQYPPKS